MNNQVNILVILSDLFYFNEQQLDRITEVSPSSTLNTVQPGEKHDRYLGEAEIIYGWPELNKLKNARRLKWLHVPSAGADGYKDREIYAGNEVILTNGSGTFGRNMAEHVLSLMLAFNRNLHLHIRDQLQSRWIRHKGQRDFFNSTVGILGLGDIGTEVAVRCKALGARVLAMRRHHCKKPDYVDRLYVNEGLDAILSNSDYIVLALPATTETTGLISKDKIELMKQNAFIVNVGRGSAIDQKALINALMTKRIAGAGLDVTSPEPLPPGNPLWKMENVIITSHTAGMSPTTNERSIAIFTCNLKRYIEGKELNNVVDFCKGY